MKFVTAVVMFLLSTAAFAQSGALIPPSALSAQSRSQLASGIAAARTTDSKPFDSVSALRAKVAVLDQRKRGGLAPVGMMLKPMGASAFWPLVEHAAFSSPARTDLTDSAWLAWRVGVLEALGMTRDSRALPIFTAVLSDANASQEVSRAAAEALGRIGTDEAALSLVKFSADPRVGNAVQSSMGTCRRLTVATALVKHADAVVDEEQAKQLAKALGEVGNSWAWKTPAIAKAQTEEGAVRQLAAEALVRLFVRFEGLARQAASNALMVVDAPNTSALIAAASREASEPTQQALTSLEQRYSRNPTK